MRALAAILLVLSACAAKSAPPGRDVSDFCVIPAEACGHRFIDEQGHIHVVTCPAGDAGIEVLGGE